jgi:hypothetical protein
MKKAILAAVALGMLATSANAGTRVRGYTRSDGTYVQPHYRSSPNSSSYDNYSTKGNSNPYTGQVGTKDPYNTYQAPAYKPYKAPCYLNCK